jgi:eukaryotic-like serine/threonine-protein kinase
VEAMRQASPNDLSLRGRVADVASWLGRVAEADGRYADALEHNREMDAALNELIALEPAVPKWTTRVADNRIFTAQTLAVMGRRAEAATALAQARATYDELTQLDPRNVSWKHIAASIRLQQVALLLAGGDTTAAGPMLQETRAQIEALFAADPSVRAYTNWLVVAWLLEGRLRFATGNGDALAAAQQVIVLGEPFVRDNRADLMAQWHLAQAWLLAGRVEQTRNQLAAARPHWERVLALLGPRADASNDWRILDPVAQAYVLTGQADRARPLLERLQRFGYRPIDPLAAPLLGAAP